MSFQKTAAHLDAHNPLTRFRARFILPRDTIYLCGNSLGLCTHDAEAYVKAALRDWQTMAVQAWTEGSPAWYRWVDEAAAAMAPLVGAAPTGVTLGASTTVNLHQLLATLWPDIPHRREVVMDRSAFPSDVHAAASFLRGRGLDPDKYLRWVEPRRHLLEEQDIIDALGPQTAVLLVPQVVYTTGQLLDIARLADAAHRAGALLILDASHAVGVTNVSLDDWEVDGAVWCTYKYLNGGPGAVAGLYLHPRHFEKPVGLAGWFGQAKQSQFHLSLQHIRAEGASGLQIGTPNILSLAGTCGGMQPVCEAGIEAIRTRSIQLTSLMTEIAETLPGAFTRISPHHAARRGGHVALAHPQAALLSRALRAQGVVGDFRPPNLLRFAPSPLFSTAQECVEAMEKLIQIEQSGSHLQSAENSPEVT